MQNIRVAIIEDNKDIRELMQIIIDGSPGFYCKRIFEDCESAIPLLLQNPPDVLLMDIDLPGMNGVEGVIKLRQENESIAILMLTIHEDADNVFESLCAGASGYLVKGLPPVKLLASIQEAKAGGAPMSPSIAAKVVRYFHRDKGHNLTKREHEILALLCAGENYTSIAEKLFISPNTVKGHIKNIYKKLQVTTRAEAVLKAHRNRIIR